MNQWQFDLAWLIWAATTAGTFTWLEFAALRSGDFGNTLSAHLRDWLGIRPHEPREPYAMIGTAAFLGGCTWLGCTSRLRCGRCPWTGGSRTARGADQLRRWIGSWAWLQTAHAWGLT